MAKALGRVIYSSDKPLNLIRSKMYLHPQLGQRLITEYLYHWVDLGEHSTPLGFGWEWSFGFAYIKNEKK